MPAGGDERVYPASSTALGGNVASSVTSSAQVSTCPSAISSSTSLRVHTGGTVASTQVPSEATSMSTTPAKILRGHQRATHLLRRGEAIVGTRRQGPTDDRVDRLRHLGACRSRRKHVLRQDCRIRGIGRRAREEVRTGQQLVKDDSHREDVRAAVDCTEAQLLGRQIARLATDGAPTRHVDRREARDAEIENTTRPLVCNMDVLRRNVLMHEPEHFAAQPAELVGGVKPAERVAHDAKRALEGHALAGRALELRDGGPLQELHGDEDLTVDLPHFVGADDIGVLEARDDRRLAEKEPACGRIRERTRRGAA